MRMHPDGCVCVFAYLNTTPKAIALTEPFHKFTFLRDSSVQTKNYQNICIWVGFFVAYWAVSYLHTYTLMWMPACASERKHDLHIQCRPLCGPQLAANVTFGQFSPTFACNKKTRLCFPYGKMATTRTCTIPDQCWLLACCMQNCACT